MPVSVQDLVIVAVLMVVAVVTYAVIVRARRWRGRVVLKTAVPTALRRAWTSTGASSRKLEP
jgi:hypothetical protein